MTTQYRIEKDLLGEVKIPADALHGIYTWRALQNFPLAGRPVRPSLIHAYGSVKLACVQTNHELGHWQDDVYQALVSACNELRQGLLDQEIAVDALQGGAGTSTNMNVNEVIANRALQLLSHKPGSYEIISPLHDVNLHQSTNDTFPTALKVAAITDLRLLEREVVALQEAFQAKEKEFADVVKIGRTQMQDAVLTTLGHEMAAYAEAFARDRWRIYKCEERLRVVNLGGTAIGTGLGAPRRFIFRAIEQLREITGLGLARAENMIEATQNTDSFVEVSGILKTLASNLLKVATDLRFLASGPDTGIGEITLPRQQAGSSIMPGKVNPVIPEAVTQAALMVMANDQALTSACGMGNLELNAFMPLIADTLLNSLQLLINASFIFRTRCVSDLQVNRQRCRQFVENATASVTALVERIGYEAAQAIALQARQSGRSIMDIVVTEKVMTETEFQELTSSESVTRLGSPDGKL